MPVTDQQVLNEIQRSLIETVNAGASWSSGLWTAAEVIGYLNQRQYRFMRETMAIIKRTDPPLAHPAGALTRALPVDWIATHRVAWKANTDPTWAFREVPRVDGWQLDAGVPDWPSNSYARPRGYADVETPTLEMRVAPAALAAGTLELLYVALTTTLSNSGVSFTVPDECVPGVKWGVVADMLSKVGRGQDLPRAAIAEEWYQLAVDATKLMVEGFL